MYQIRSCIIENWHKRKYRVYTFIRIGGQWQTSVITEQAFNFRGISLPWWHCRKMTMGQDRFLARCTTHCESREYLRILRRQKISQRVWRRPPLLPRVELFSFWQFSMHWPTTKIWSSSSVDVVHSGANDFRLRNRKKQESQILAKLPRK